MPLANPTCARQPYVPHLTGSSFRRFWPYYLGEHSVTSCRRLHVLGTSCAIAALAAWPLTRDARLLAAAPLAGYGFAWVGHFFFEHNRPSTFRHPLYSLLGDLKLFWEVLTCRRPF